MTLVNLLYILGGLAAIVLLIFIYKLVKEGLERFDSASEQINNGYRFFTLGKQLLFLTAGAMLAYGVYRLSEGTIQTSVSVWLNRGGLLFAAILLAMNFWKVRLDFAIMGTCLQFVAFGPKLILLLEVAKIGYIVVPHLWPLLWIGLLALVVFGQPTYDYVIVARVRRF